MARVLIVIGGHLSTAPRPCKEAQALSGAGHEVVVYGNWYDAELAERDRALLKNDNWTFVPIVDLLTQGRFRSFIERLQNKAARVVYKRLGLFSERLLGYAPKAMLRAARQAKCDLTIVHSEAGLWVGNQLLDDGLNVGVDFEDWFSEDLLPAARSTRPIAQLKQLEARLARECRYRITTSTVMSKAIAKAYRASEPAVVYNAFSFSERKTIDGRICDRKNLDRVSLHWFSQTIGPGRGLEILFQALSYLDKPVEVHIRGNHPKSYRQWLQDLIPEGWDDRIFIHPTVPPAELLSRIAEHDIGLALDVPCCQSRRLTITNKLFQYLQGGLAVVATETAGQKEVFSACPEIGKLLDANDPEAIALAINHFLNSPASLSRAKKAALVAAQTLLNWEYQENKLLEVAERALAKPRDRSLCETR